MTTLVFDIDGTLTDMWPLERLCLATMLGRAVPSNLKDELDGNLYRIYSSLYGGKVSKKDFGSNYRLAFQSLLESDQLPKPASFRSVDFIKANQSMFKFVFATGGWRVESEYVLEQLGCFEIFDSRASICKDNCRYKKSTDIPFLRLKKAAGLDMVVITDTKADIEGASRAGLASILLKQNQELTTKMINKALTSV